MILFLEYRWLVKPVVRMAAVLRSGESVVARTDAYAPRRDEIGAFAQALIHHFQLVQSQQQLASQQQQGLSERLARQENFRRESMSFQARIAEIVQRLEGHAGRMSTASGNLVTISSEADARAAASAQSTQRVSGHVDVVASSIRDIAAHSDRSRGRGGADIGGRGGRAQPGRCGKERRQCADRSGAHDRAGHRPDRGRRQSDQSAWR